MYKNYTKNIAVPKRHLFKLLLIMKMTALTILAAFMQVSALSVAQTVTLKKENVTLKTVFSEISRQTGFVVLAKSEVLENAKPVSVNLYKADIHTAIKETLKGQPLDFTIRDGTIVIQQKLPSFPESLAASYADITVRGRVVDAQGNSLAGANVKVKGTNRSTVTNSDGEFTLTGVDEGAVLVISFLGYDTRELKAAQNLGTVQMLSSSAELEEVSVVSTGYQSLPKERATGSFVLIDSALLNRSVTTNILERLDGVTSGLSFAKTVGGVGFNGSPISIRGRSTINGDPDPLVILDNFPFNGDVSSINPNDIESISILKDAAAASIWGTKAGNGVIVITTKSGKFNQKTVVSLNSNMTVGQKPQLYSQQQFSSAEFIEIEQFLFDRGAYNSTINNGYAALSPAVEIMLLQRSGQIDVARRDQMLDSLSQYDTRRELLDYYYRTPVNQQYNLNISGGSESQKFFLSGGFDRNVLTAASTSFQRFSINGQNTFSLWKDRGQLISGIQFSNSNDKIGRGLPTNYTRYPYMNFADENGNALASPADLRFSYIAAQSGKGLLDWYYRPLDELGDYRSEVVTSFRLNNNFTYRLFKPLKIALFHTYQRGVTDVTEEYDKDSYYARHQVNMYTSIDQATGAISRPIAVGNITTFGKEGFISNSGRLQLILDQPIGQSGVLNGIAGAEVSDYLGDSNYATLYGYNPEIGTNSNSNIDFTRNYPVYYASTSRISTGLNSGGSVDRYVSSYANLSYNHDEKYIISASARKDESNIFGVKSNQKGVPLWSAGLSWEISKERFYRFSALPYLRFRATYGYNGNVDKSTSAYLTASPSSPPNNSFNVNSATIINPPNPALRWEKVQNVNFAVDFGVKNRRFSGTIELYRKLGTDLIGTTPIAPQTGISEFTGNSANLKTKGIDVTVNTINTTGRLKWNSILLFNYVRDEVTKYLATPGSNLEIVQANYNTPLIGYPYDSNFSFIWAGLDNTGSPQAYLNNEVSKDYTAIRNSLDRSNIVFSGPRSPTYFGGLLNTFAWDMFELSFNIVYRAGYSLRRNSLGNIYGVNYTGNYDYALRWQQPGDELTTNVPAPVYPANTNRQTVYTYSDVLMYKADQVRLQDARLSIKMHEWLRPVKLKQLSAFIYASNLGILWRANKYNIDPDSPTIRQVHNLSFGLTAQF